MGQRSERVIQHKARPVSQLSEFCRCSWTVAHRQIGLCSNIGWIKSWDRGRSRVGKLKGSRDPQIIDGFRGSRLSQVDLCANRGKPVFLNDCALGPLFVQFVAEGFGLI